jgi:hypothetical protein
MPFHFNSNINLANLRIGVRPQNEQNPDPNFPAFLAKLAELGAKPKNIGAPPTVAGSQGGLGAESAAAFDTYVQMKAKELGMDMATVVATFGGRGGGGGGGRAVVVARTTTVDSSIAGCLVVSRRRWISSTHNAVVKCSSRRGKST